MMHWHHFYRTRVSFAGMLMLWFWILLLIGGLIYIFAGPYHPTSADTAVTPMCHAGRYADRSCTPGATFAHVTRADVCSRGWASRHRHTTEAQRHRVFAAYGIEYSSRSGYEFDHLIPLEAGGSNVDKNMWPEPLALAKLKDDVEDSSHAKICAGERTVAQVKAFIRRKYTRSYR